MIARGADHRADQRQLVHHRCQAGQVLANLDARNLGFDRLELAANFRWGVHLEVEDVLVRRATRQENHDDCFVGGADA